MTVVSTRNKNLIKVRTQRFNDFNVLISDTNCPKGNFYGRYRGGFKVRRTSV